MDRMEVRTTQKCVTPKLTFPNYRCVGSGTLRRAARFPTATGCTDAMPGQDKGDVAKIMAIRVLITSRGEGCRARQTSIAGRP